MTEQVKWDAEATDSAARVEYVEDGISVTIAARSFEGGPLSVDGTTIPWAMVGPVIEGIGRVMAAKDRGDSAPCRHEQGFWHTGGIDRCPDCGIAATGDEDDCPLCEGPHVPGELHLAP